MTVPEWVQDAVFYQIFPDRFSNGDVSNDPPGKVAWGTKPEVVQFQGGDLRGVINHIDYLVDLGINAIYFNPIFEAVTNHRYDTVDYKRIDRKLGSLEDFKELLETAHQHGIKVILDGVFNHCSRGFYAFLDILQHEEKSGYKNWFHIYRFPLNAYTPGKAVNFESWWGYKSLPKFNTDCPDVRAMLLDVARYWIELGVDGWRLDVPNEIDDDEFWAEFRRVVKESNPEAYILGEIWEAQPRWVGEDKFDGVMDYPVRTAILNLLNGSITTAGFADQMEMLCKVYPFENVKAMYVPLGSHDVERIMSMVGDDVNKLKLATILQFTYPGAPAVYYGDEIGLTGGKDPDCRKAFPWNQDDWNVDLRNWFKKLIKIRRDHEALRRGTYQRVMVDAVKGGYAFRRKSTRQEIVVVVNAGKETRSFNVPVGWKNGTTLMDLIHGHLYVVAEGAVTVELKAWAGAILDIKPM